MIYMFVLSLILITSSGNSQIFVFKYAKYFLRLEVIGNPSDALLRSEFAIDFLISVRKYPTKLFLVSLRGIGHMLIISVANL